MMGMENLAFTVSVWVLPVLIAVTFHEAAHGWVAWRLGDDTAYRLGRVTFNPLSHIDLFGTILLPALMLFASGGKMMFGFAKPVPVNFAGLGHPRRDMVLVALAGPGSNLLLAVISAALIHLLPMLSGDVYQWAGHNLINSMRINLLLCVFNMLPMPPLDGGRVAVGLLGVGIGGYEAAATAVGHGTLEFVGAAFRVEQAQVCDRHQAPARVAAEIRGVDDAERVVESAFT